jgi:hypothetical protein
MQTGWPPQPLRNILRLAPDFQVRFSWLALVAAGLATLAWLWLVRWRTARHRHPLWKSLVLPASGVTLVWLLTMTLLLPPLDHGRSPKPLVNLVRQWVPAESCLQAPGLSRANVAALTLFGPYTVHAATPEHLLPGHCRHMVLHQRLPATLAERNRLQPPAVPSGWTLLGKVQRPGEVTEVFLVLVKR